MPGSCSCGAVQLRLFSRSWRDAAATGHLSKKESVRNMKHHETNETDESIETYRNYVKNLCLKSLSLRRDLLGEKGSASIRNDFSHDIPLALLGTPSASIQIAFQSFETLLAASFQSFPLLFPTALAAAAVAMPSAGWKSRRFDGGVSIRLWEDFRCAMLACAESTICILSFRPCLWAPGFAPGFGEFGEFFHVALDAKLRRMVHRGEAGTMMLPGAGLPSRLSEARSDEKRKKSNESDESGKKERKVEKLSSFFQIWKNHKDWLIDESIGKSREIPHIFNILQVSHSSFLFAFEMIV